MSCSSSPGATHHHGCSCSEAQWAALARETARREEAERGRDEARDSLGEAVALAMIPLARGEHFKDVPDTQPHAAIARIREDLNECRAERDEARNKLVGVNVLKCLLVDAEKARDEALAKLAASPNLAAGHVVAFLTGLPVELNTLLPEGSIFMHPRTFRGLPTEHPSWLDRMRAEKDVKP